MQGVFKSTGLETQFHDDGVIYTVRSGDLEISFFSPHYQYRRNLEFAVRSYNEFCANRLKPCEVIAFPKGGGG